MSRDDVANPIRPVLARHADPAELRRRRRDGTLLPLRRGAYLPAAQMGQDPQHRQRQALATIAAVNDQLTMKFWFSHGSAALIWGCSVVGLDPRAHVTQQHRPGSRRDLTLIRHHGALPASERTVVGGLPVTTIERTVVDCAASMPAGQALVIADSALRRGASTEVIQRLLAARVGHRGVHRARRVLALADARAESPGESLCRWAVVEAGLVAPELQVAVATRIGTFWLDLGWPEQKVAIEFDGFVKYSGADGRTAPEVVFAEKRRQDALVELGWVIVRVTWADLRRPELIAARVRTALHRRSARHSPRDVADPRRGR